MSSFAKISSREIFEILFFAKINSLKVDGSEVVNSDKKVHHFSITKLGKRKKGIMSEPIESVIIRVQQNFDVVGGLNPIQIEINDDTVIDILKKCTNVVYKVIPLGLLFPASIKNDTRQIFVLAKTLNGVNKCILTYILAAIDLNKIENWKDVKGKSI